MQAKRNKLVYYSNGLVARWKNKRLSVIKQDDGNFRVVIKRLVDEKDKEVLSIYNAGFLTHVKKNKIIVTQFVLSPEAFEALNHAYGFINSQLIKDLKISSDEKEAKCNN
jgi:hypothetical protein